MARRELPWPEIILGACLVVIIVLFLWGSGTHACRDWKLRLNGVSGAFLTGNAENPVHEEPEARADLRAEMREVLDDRPFGCF